MVFVVAGASLCLRCFAPPIGTAERSAQIAVMRALRRTSGEAELRDAISARTRLRRRVTSNRAVIPTGLALQAAFVATWASLAIHRLFARKRNVHLAVVLQLPWRQRLRRFQSPRFPF